MPNQKHSHEENRALLCVLCLGKTQVRALNVSPQKMLQQQALPSFHEDEFVLPSSICDGCRRRFSSPGDSTQRSIVLSHDHVQLVQHLKSQPSPTRSDPNCHCELSGIASSKAKNPRSIYAPGSAAVGRPRASPALPTARPVKQCSSYLTELAKGKPHAIFARVSEFRQKSGSGLGAWSEQASESVHHDFLQTGERFKVPEQHPKCGERLQQAVVCYSLLLL